MFVFVSEMIYIQIQDGLFEEVSLDIPEKYYLKPMITSTYIHLHWTVIFIKEFLKAVALQQEALRRVARPAGHPTTQVARRVGHSTLAGRQVGPLIQTILPFEAGSCFHKIIAISFFYSMAMSETRNFEE